MKITGIDVYDVKATWRRGWNPVIVRVRSKGYERTSRGTMRWRRRGIGGWRR